jgi:hypothetical protein
MHNVSGARSANELAHELQDALNESLALEQLSLAEVTEGGDARDFSLINPPPIGSSTGRTKLSSLQSTAVPCHGSADNSSMGGPGVGGPL